MAAQPQERDQPVKEHTEFVDDEQGGLRDLGAIASSMENNEITSEHTTENVVDGIQCDGAARGDPATRLAANSDDAVLYCPDGDTNLLYAHQLQGEVSDDGSDDFSSGDESEHEAEGDGCTGVGILVGGAGTRQTPSRPHRYRGSLRRRAGSPRSGGDRHCRQGTREGTDEGLALGVAGVAPRAKRARAQ